MQKIAKKGLEFVKSGYDWFNIMNEYEKCYLTLLANNPKLKI